MTGGAANLQAGEAEWQAGAAERQAGVKSRVSGVCGRVVCRFEEAGVQVGGSRVPVGRWVASGCL